MNPAGATATSRRVTSSSLLLWLVVAVTMLAAACSTVDTETAPTTSAADAAETADPETDDASESASSTDSSDSAEPADSSETGTETDASEAEPEPTDEPATAEPEPTAEPTEPEPSTTAADIVAMDENSCEFNELLPLPVAPTCYTLTVPEDWDEPSPESVVTIPVAVFEATGDNPSPDPVIYLEGGPGGHSLDGLVFSFQSLVMPHLETRDFIAFDQRGAGLSTPSLTCPEITSIQLEALQTEGDYEAELAAELAATEQCHARLTSDGADLTEYHSINSANDLDALRAALGYEQVNLLGISYGTRLAQTAMRLHPTSIRSVILDSILPTEAELFSALSTNAQRSFKRLFDQCAADTQCAAAYPDFETRYFDLVDELNTNPIPVEAQNPVTGETVTVVADGVDLLNATFSALYTSQAFAALPQLVADAEQGEYTVMEALASQQLLQLDFISYGMLLSVQCHEDLPFDDRANLLAYEPSGADYEQLGDFVSGTELFDACDAWPAGTAPAVEDQLVTSDIPALLLGGEYDPITPPSGIDAVAQGLDTSWSFVFPHEGHAVAPTACGAVIINEFLDTPDQEPDGSCLTSTASPAFTPRPIGDIEFVPFETSILGSTVSGTRPDGWVDQGFGIYSRGETIVDPTLLIVQGTFGTPASLLTGLLAESFSDLVGEEIEFAPDGQIDAGGSTWELIRSTTDDQHLVMAINDELLVGIAARPTEVENIIDSVLRPVLETASAS